MWLWTASTGCLKFLAVYDYWGNTRGRKGKGRRGEKRRREKRKGEERGGEERGEEGRENRESEI